ncbi:MAG TPA: hypothetical protein VK492_16780 [Chitinophagaceae bacterium]|nr:hypothetical protein [Chitinophagaceae bacterium]
MLPLILLVCCCSAYAQDSTIIIKAGTSFNESVSVTDLYEYPQFVYGKVFFKLGDSSSARLNYSRFLDEMHFIDLKGDTLNIAYPGTIKFIRISNDLFYYDNGYVKLIKDNNTIKLAAKKTLKMSGKYKIGAYNTASTTSAIDSYSSLTIDHKNYNLTPREDVTLTKKTEYYFGDKYNHFVLANKKNILRLYSKQEGAVTTYLKENNVDFNKPEDIEKLFQYLTNL